MEQSDQGPASKRSAKVDSEVPEEDDVFAQIGQADATPAESGTTIPVDFETPSIHMEEGGGEDIFNKLGSELNAPEPDVADATVRPEAEHMDPIQLVEDAANDLFDTLGVEHYDPTAGHIESKEILQGDRDTESLAAAIDTETPGVVDDSQAGLEDYQEVAEASNSEAEGTRTENTSTAPEAALGDSATEAADVFDTLDTSGPIDSPTEPLSAPNPPTASLVAEEDRVIIEDGGDGDDIFATLASDESPPEVDATHQAEVTPAAQASTPGIELVETEHDSLFDNIGASDGQPEDLAESGDSLEEQERKYQLLLAEFGEEEHDFLPDSNTHQAAGLFGGKEGSTPFDEFIPGSEPEYLQTASSSTTPPPNLSIENSLQDIEPYEGDTSMMTETSDWLGETSMEADQSFQIQDSADASSPVDFEVPYGWYEGDTFHYYTDEQREHVRMAMLDAQPQTARSMTQSQDSTAAPLIAPTSGFSENSARRTPNPDQYSDPYGPSTSRLPATSSTSSYFGDSQYTASTTSTDPYAPASSQASPAKPYDPYAPTTPSAGPYDPYAEVLPAKQPIYYGNQKKPAAFAKSAPAARPAPPTRVASTAYDPPFLRPQKSFVRPASAVPLASTSYAAPPVPPLPPVQAAPTPPPPSGPPRRSTTPYAPSPPVVDRPSRQPTPVQPSAYAPIQPSVYAPEERAPASPIAPPAAPPRGPPSRPSSSMAAARQAQRAPSYNSFDPPLRTQTLSRASMKAPPPQTPPAPSFALSPPTENIAQFDGSRPPSRAASAFEAPHRPSSRAAPGFEAPPALGPPRPSSRATSAKFGAPPTGPPRPPSRATPAFEAPPPPGPPRRSVSSFQPPPRPPSTTYHAPAREPSPLSASRQNDPEEEQITLPASSFEIPQLHSGEEPDEEGGAWNEDEIDGFERDSVTESRLGDKDRQGFNDEPESLYERLPARQATYDSYSSESAYAPAPTRSGYSPAQSQSASYEPYGPGHHEGSNDDTGSRDQYQSNYAPAPARSGYSPEPLSPARNDPYGPGGHDVPKTDSNSQYAPPPVRSGYSPVQSQTASYDPYGPGQHDVSTKSNTQTAAASVPYDPYAPTTSMSPRAPLAELSSLGLSSLGASAPSAQNTYDSPYAPARSAAEQYTPGGDNHLRVASPDYGTEYGTSPPANNYFSAMATGPADQTYTPQQVLDQRPVSEDPLGRSTLAARNAPIAIFGFGGVLITAFPGMANAHNEAAGGHSRTASYGYASGRGQLWIRSVSDLVSESALKSNETVFPGPLVFDPSSTKGAAGDKKKKEAVLEYLKARVEETEKGLPYLKTSANATRREQEGKLVLIRLLLAMIIGEGKLTGSQAEDAVREALQNPSNPPTSSTTFSPTSVSGPASNGFGTAQYQGTNQNTPSAATSPSQLSQLSTMLSNGDKRDAALYAASNGLWSHALLISSSVDQDFWREIVSRFSGAELHAGVTGSAGLKASYTLFAGSSATTVDDLFTAAHVSDDPSADQWREVVGAVLFNGKSADLTHLDELGARLTSAGLINAGHVCSILSPTSAFSDLTPGALDRSISLVQSTRDEDAVIFAEIAEYARSLIPVPKGQELPFPGLPQLLPYKLHRAWGAAELGDHDLAKRYCTAVESASKVGKTGTSLLSRPFLNSLEDLQERLTGDPSTKPANLIGGRKAGKPGVNKLGSWIEGRLTKFIAGEEDTPGPVKATPPVKGKETGAPVGPFSHFSTISPGPSNPVTRATSIADMANGQHGGRLSPAPQGGHQPTSSSSSSLYGEQYNAGGGGGYGGYNQYSGQSDENADQEDTPHALEPAGDGGEVELLNPMAALSLGPTRQSQNDYGPPAKTRHVEEEEDDDLGFGNTSLSRARTPKPADGGDEKPAAKKKEPAAKAATPEPIGGKNEPKSGWLRGWFGKKEGEGSGPIVAKLGEESSMIFDPELKRWVVKGAKPEPAAAAPPPPPPSRPSSAATASRASSATPPPSLLSRSTGSQGSGTGMPPRPSGMGFAEMPDGGIRRQKSSLAESATPGMTPPPPGGGPPRPPSGPPKPPGSSIDDLLSRPPSKRPASAARKGVKNRYVDVFQGEGNP